MRFLANENIPMPSVRRLREAGHDVAAIVEDSPGIDDTDILARAASEQRYLLTFDRDYGELIYRLGLPSPPGIVYIRFAPATPTEAAEYLLTLLGQSSISLQGQFNVIERDSLRQRPLPS
jgi:predicted nuclease of predicted toxin-antitoxin system